ncbi:MAG: ABC transporter ATP-binding protein [Phycisphaerales bacterium]
MGSTAIHIKDLVKAFPGVGAAPPTTAVDHVTLSIEPGELFFLLGPSGCGKTTLLRMIAGFIEPTSGQILFDSGAGGATDVTFLPAEKRDTGMVFQSYALWPHMTVAQNVAFGLEVRKTAKDQRETLVREALAQVRMEQYAQRKPNQLSGGQQQRVALARAIVIKPRVLLLDEPLSNLDAKLRIELRGEIRRVCKAAGTTTVYVTHDQKEALSMADRVAIMRGGCVQQVGTPGALYREPGTRFVAEFLGETNIIPGTIEGEADGLVRVRTDLGTVQAAVRPHSPTAAPGTPVLLSVRHEAVQLGQYGVNRIAARAAETTYLGEVMQVRLEAAGGVSLHASALNPRSDEVRADGCSVDPHDVAILPVSQ